ncbi:hypothetical protein BSY15_2825 [Acidovorax sp. RAC01]|nr:hypothetical protein BSY15_2825 [Acidovorax sp. RAC01]
MTAYYRRQEYPGVIACLSQAIRTCLTSEPLLLRHPRLAHRSEMS